LTRKTFEGAQMNRRRGILWLTAGLFLAIVAAGIAYFTFQQAVSQQAADTAVEQSTQTVVVVKQLINERAVIRLEDVGTEEHPIEEIPSGAIFKTEDAIGRIATRSFQPGQILLTQNLVESFTANADIAATDSISGTINFNEVLGSDRVAYALPATDRLSMEGILLPGDHVDLLFSTDVVGEDEGTGGKVSIYSLQSLEILQIIYQAPPPPAEGEEAPAEQPVRVAKTIILAIDPQDATVLKYAIDAQAAIDLALRAEENERLFEVDPVTINTLSDRYDFSSPRPVP
jgi:pilus assembly protein CpaB